MFGQLTTSKLRVDYIESQEDKEYSVDINQVQEQQWQQLWQAF